MGSFLENIVKNVVMGSLSGSSKGGGLQDILGKLSTGGLQDILGKLGGMATGSINIINIAKEAMGGAMAKAATESKADDGFEEVE